ncbi:MAG: hypothetical protein JST08_18795 [Actinobacteria bacterium]|nr:hypothetical protein [Actinomycetota bacterium]
MVCAIEAELISLGVPTIGELRQGVERIRRRDPAAASRLDSRPARVVETDRDRPVPVDRLVAENPFVSRRVRVSIV